MTPDPKQETQRQAPERGLLVEPVRVGGKEVPAGKYVWYFGDLSRPRVEVEYRDRRALVETKCLVATPVPPPDRARLQSFDLCFGLGIEAFVEVHRDSDLLFSVYRCKAHGAYFLEDVRGGILMYSRFVFIGRLESPSEREFVEQWERIHGRSDDSLFLEGVATSMPAHDPKA